MTLRRFLDAAYTLLIEEYQRIGVNLMEATEKMAEYRAGGNVEPEVSEAIRNTQSLQQLDALMARVR